MPNSGEPAFRVGEDLIDEPTARRIWRAQLPQLAIPVLGLPAVSVPTGLHDGVPMGAQIDAGRFREELCLDAERKSGGSEKRVQVRVALGGCRLCKKTNKKRKNKDILN